MDKKKILILFISYNSGHHCAALAIEKALRLKRPDTEILTINSFNYTNPLLEKVINNAYMGIIKTTPEVWDYLYDNPKILRRSRKIRSFIHKHNSGKLKKLLDDFKPDAIVCTQAFPCGMIADYKLSFGVDTPLVGVLTDYYPHSYWLFDSVNGYVVPSQEAKGMLIKKGVAPNKIFVYGIPIEPKFNLPVDKAKICRVLGLDEKLPKVLIMGGGQGLGAIKDIVKQLDKATALFQIIVVAGTNRALKDWLERKLGKFKKAVVIFGYTDMVNELMSVSDMIVTKPGGLTTAEALARGLPMIISHPLPGQEAKNTEFLIKEGVAKRTQKPKEVAKLIVEMLNNGSLLHKMHEQTFKHAHPQSAAECAELIFKLMEKNG